MARVRNLHRIDLYCPEYMTNATILIDQNHHSGQPHLVAHYELVDLMGQMQFAAAIPAHWGDDDLIELIFLPLEKRENHNHPTWEVPTRDHGSATLFKFWEGQKAPEIGHVNDRYVHFGWSLFLRIAEELMDVSAAANCLPYRG